MCKIKEVKLSLLWDNFLKICLSFVEILTSRNDPSRQIYICIYIFSSNLEKCIALKFPPNYLQSLCGERSSMNLEVLSKQEALPMAVFLILLI